MIHRPGTARFPLLLISLLCLSIPGVRLEAEDKRVAVAVLPPRLVTQTPEAESYQAVLHKALEAELEARKFELISQEQLLSHPEYQSLKEQTFLPAERVVPLGKSVRAQVIVATTFGLEGNRLFIHVKGFDVRTSRLAAAVSESGFAGLAGFSFSEQAATRFSERLATYRETYDPHEPISLEVIASLVFLSADEGMVVRLENREKGETIQGGQTEVPYVPFRVGTKIVVLKEKEGYYPEAEKFELKPGENRLQLKPLLKKHKNEIGVGWTLGESLGGAVEYRRYLEADYLFLSLCERFYLQHDSLPGSRPVFHNDASLSMGGYIWGSYKDRFRVGLAFGMGVIVTSFSVPEMPVYTDYYLNLGSPFLEANFNPWAISATFRLQYGLGMGNNLLGRTFFFIQTGGIPVTLGVRRKW